MKKISTSGRLTSPVDVSKAVRYLVERGDVTGRILEVDPDLIESTL
jgi:hypothetical protein